LIQIEICLEEDVEAEVVEENEVCFLPCPSGLFDFTNRFSLRAMKVSPLTYRRARWRNCFQHRVYAFLMETIM
jgi:hypothetical protein